MSLSCPEGSDWFRDAGKKKKTVRKSPGQKSSKPLPTIKRARAQQDKKKSSKPR